MLTQSQREFRAANEAQVRAMDKGDRLKKRKARELAKWKLAYDARVQRDALRKVKRARKLAAARARKHRAKVARERKALARAERLARLAAKKQLRELLQ